MGAATVIRAEGLGKAYRHYASPAGRVLEALSLGRVRAHEPRWALRDVSFELARGAALGLSTLR